MTHEEMHEDDAGRTPPADDAPRRDDDALRRDDDALLHADDMVPAHGYTMLPLVALGGSAGGLPALKEFFAGMPARTGLAYVVVLHLSPNHESTLAGILAGATGMRVIEVENAAMVEPDTVYVIPPRKTLKSADGWLVLDDMPPGRVRHVAIDIFFRTVADTHGPHAAAVVLSGMDGDGAAGIKRVKEHGGLTLAQNPEECEHDSMPRTAIATGMIDWVLPVREMPARIAAYFGIEKALRLPSEESAAEQKDAVKEDSLREILLFLRTRTGRNFFQYKRATIVRRIARRMQICGVDTMPAYLATLRTVPGEAPALLQDLLISVTNFFRDTPAFTALEREIPGLFAGKGEGDTVRVWVAACATGEEAYSVAMLLSEHARTLESPPLIHVFASDLDDAALQVARDGTYGGFEADISEERLRRFFVREHRGWRVRRELREMVLFAVHDVLKDAPFSRLDLVTCRNMLIYLNREAQGRVLETFNFALLPGGLLLLGSTESVDESSPAFEPLDKANRLYRKRAGHFPHLLPGARAAYTPGHGRVTVLPSKAFDLPLAPPAAAERRDRSWAELHLRLLEHVGPPSLLVDGQMEIVHLSPSVGRFLQHTGGEPTRDVLRVVTPLLRVELRAALSQAQKTQAIAEVAGIAARIDGEALAIDLRVTPVREFGHDLYLVTLAPRVDGTAGATAPSERQAAAANEVLPAVQRADREVERLRAQLRDTVEQYETTTQELKAGNEELQAMNEELRSASEELETSREELQSINEELTTVNQQLKSNVDELAHANSDMHNLMDATAIATIFLDRSLRITRYTPSATSLFNLIPTDVGRPLSDLKTQIEYADIMADARKVLERLVPIEREVGQANGSWHLVRILPYRTLDDHIAGVVLAFVDITERKKAQEAQLWLSAVVAASSDAIVSFGMDGSILTWNTGALRIFGYTAEEAVGQPLSMLLPGDKPLAAIMERVAQGSDTQDLEIGHLRKDGGMVHVSATVSPIRDAAGKVIAGSALLRDISESRRAREALAASEERLRLVLENAREYAIFSTDLEGRVTSWNSGAERLLGYREREIIGRPADLIFTDEDRAAGAPRQEMQTAMDEGRAADERWHQRKDGSRFWGSGAMMLMRDSAGQKVGLVKILRDETTAREAREILVHSRAELAASDAAKDRFIAVLSHELRNPLASIDSAASILASASTQADRVQAAQIVARQARVMKTLLDDLLDISRLRLGKIELRRQPVALDAVVAGAVENTKPLLEAAGHAFTVELPKAAPVVDADPVRLVQAVANLLSNAIRYTHAPGRLSLSLRISGDRALIAVTDNGMGMEPAQIESLFAMFSRGEHPGGPAMERSREGLGIGLALARDIAHLHGGELTGHSAGRGRGSEFVLSLPIDPASHPAIDAEPASPPLAQAASQRGLVLVIDDNVDASWGLGQLLEMSGWTVMRGANAAQALELARDHAPLAAVVDIGLPDMSGHDLARKLRGTRAGRKMALVAATGWGQQADEAASMAAGFDLHMTKPVSAPVLSTELARLIARNAKP